MRQHDLNEQSPYEMLIIVLLAIITTPLALLITLGPGPTPLTTRPKRLADIAPPDIEWNAVNESTSARGVPAAVGLPTE